MMIIKFFKKSEKGFALLMTLWIMVLLIAIVTEFSFTMRTEVNITRNTKDDVQAYYLAMAGYNRAIGEITENQNYWIEDNKIFFGSSPSIVTDSSEIYEKKKAIKRDSVPLGSGYYTYDIESEASKSNINYIQQAEWAERLKNSGLEDDSLIDTITNGIEDWKDKDTDLHRDTTMPGEDEDYLSEEVYKEEKGLEFPYECKDGNFDSVEELLLIRGMTPEILYGSDYSEMGFDNSETDNKNTDEKKLSGIYDQLTIYNVRGVDIYLASRDTLEAIAPYNGPALERLQQLDSGLLDDEVPKSRQTYNEFFTIISTGKIKNSDVQHTIRAVVKKVRSTNSDDITVIRWDDDYILPEKKDTSSETTNQRKFEYEKKSQPAGGTNLNSTKTNKSSGLGLLGAR
jgi:general secretion pathway protein K